MNFYQIRLNLHICQKSAKSQILQKIVEYLLNYSLPYNKYLILAYSIKK